MSHTPPILDCADTLATRPASGLSSRGAPWRCPACALAFAFAAAPGCIEPAASSSAHVRSSTAGPPPRAAGPVCAPVRASGNSPLIDDFETAPNRLIDSDGRRGWWFGYDDGSRGSILREEVDVDDGGRKNRALHVAASGFVKWGAGFGVELLSGGYGGKACAYDASVHTGVRLRARGHGRIRLALGDAKSTPPAQGGSCSRPTALCYDRPGAWINLEEDWKTYELPFCAFLTEGWGGSSDGVSPSDLLAIHFRVGEREDVEAWLDDLAFYTAAPTDPPPRCGLPCPLESVPHSATLSPGTSTAPLTDELEVHTFDQATKACGPLTRRYLSYVPRRLGARSSAPVLLVLHGSGANAESARTFQAQDRFDALATRDGFIAVYGNAAPGASTSPDPGFPNTGAWRQGLFDDGQVDDIAYLERVLDDLRVRGVIEGHNPVFITGLSNGGGMTLAAARRLGHRLTGVAALMPYDGEQPEPVPDLTGTPLKRVLLAYTFDDPGMTPGYHERLAPMPARWAAAMGVPASVIAAPEKRLLPNAVFEGEGYRGQNPTALATRNSQVTEWDMVAPGGGAQVRVLVMDHAGHFWPNARQNTEDRVLDRWGFRNQDFDAADMVWEFMRTALK